MGPPAPSSGISAEARKFMLLSGSASWETVQLSAEGVALLRSENSEAAEAGCRKVLSEVGVALEDGMVGGVPVQWVAPHTLRGEEVLLFFFGGGFLCGCPEDDLSISARLADALGRRVCAPRYRLAPEHTFPAARNDALAVYQGLLAVGRGAIVVVGESAGGNLALSLVLSVASAGLAPPLAVALLSPWVDLTHSGDSHSTLEGVDPTLSVRHFLEPASLAYAGEYASRSDPAISPLFAALPPRFPPTIISTATRDLLLSDAIRLEAKLRAHGTQVELRVAEGLWHVFEWYPALPEAAESVDEIAAFLVAFLGEHTNAKRACTAGAESPDRVDRQQRRTDRRDREGGARTGDLRRAIGNGIAPGTAAAAVIMACVWVVRRHVESSSKK